MIEPKNEIRDREEWEKAPLTGGSVKQHLSVVDLPNQERHQQSSVQLCLVWFWVKFTIPQCPLATDPC